MLSVVPAGIEPVLITRWRPDEVAAGVSDTQVLPVLRARGGTVYLHDRLHAKYYRNEHRVLIGSANLTATALGWAALPNIELLVESDMAAAKALEAELLGSGVVATDEIAANVDELARLLGPPVNSPRVDIAHRPVGMWMPSLRLPADLFAAYSRGPATLTSHSAAAASSDLAVLDMPLGLERSQFERLVAHRLLHHPIFQQIDEFLAVPRRFGEVRELIGDVVGMDRHQADESWQTIMRWMLEFLPHRYKHSVNRHSEIVARRDDADRN
ncbi:hypothetical protein [Mycolicibacterium peregrinum]|uniref:Uncharacterized protein n=1 Tax=Mycolicibacterium peregrinum TaxID=43304 RepID=A0A4Z0HTU9_MYCPR|nr:hypothetical protein [Mycolicibacterium peregrinum]TGB44641.1 hypothetical protein EJD94_08995 [Mycolicibacterium peregrinum]TGB46948.1 hypothetical protein EJD98_03505 [Mycolicibacterium peregrinum]